VGKFKFATLFKMHFEEFVHPISRISRDKQRAQMFVTVFKKYIFLKIRIFCQMQLQSIREKE
jgi:hypothetical protein